MLFHPLLMKGITKMLNQKVLLPILILILAISSIIGVVATSPREAHPRGPEEGYQPPFSRDSMRPGPEEDWQPLRYELDPQNANVKVSLEQAIEKVKDAWPVPSDAMADSTIMRDDLKNYTYWKLDWSSSGSLTAFVDANTGKVLVISDFRRSGGVDNLKGDEGRAIKVGEEVLAKLGINTDGLSKPVLKKIDMPHAISWKLTYTVLWVQTHQGLLVKGASVRAGIDAETLKPIAFSNHLIDVQDLNVVPAISEAQAIEAAEKYVQSEAITSRGYEQCEVRNLELVIDRPNHDLTRDKILVPLGEPTLVWYVHVRNAIRGWFIDVMVDAQTGAVVGLIFGL
jgi:uncharacterized membrane protein YkoI